MIATSRGRTRQTWSSMLRGAAHRTDLSGRTSRQSPLAVRTGGAY
ncbi:hypothetical protein YT1_p10008 (plasmid) [Rhodococcus ruber]|nr:hypothetical protein YT1_p10008 [Rhodococcus ruber]